MWIGLVFFRHGLPDRRRLARIIFAGDSQIEAASVGVALLFARMREQHVPIAASMATLPTSPTPTPAVATLKNAITVLVLSAR